MMYEPVKLIHGRQFRRREVICAENVGYFRRLWHGLAGLMHGAGAAPGAAVRDTPLLDAGSHGLCAQRCPAQVPGSRLGWIAAILKSLAAVRIYHGSGMPSVSPCH